MSAAVFESTLSVLGKRNRRAPVRKLTSPTFADLAQEFALQAPESSFGNIKLLDWSASAPMQQPSAPVRRVKRARTTSSKSVAVAADPMVASMPSATEATLLCAASLATAFGALMEQAMFHGNQVPQPVMPLLQQAAFLPTGTLSPVSLSEMPTPVSTPTAALTFVEDDAELPSRCVSEYQLPEGEDCSLDQLLGELSGDESVEGAAAAAGAVWSCEEAAELFGISL